MEDVPMMRQLPRWQSPSEDEESEDDVEIVDGDAFGIAPQLDEMEVDRDYSIIDADLFEEVESPVLPNLSQELNDDGSPRTDERKLPRLENLEEWRNRIRAQSGGHDYTLHAPSTKEAALAFITMLKEITMGTNPRDYKPDPPIKCKIKSRLALLSPIRPFTM